MARRPKSQEERRAARRERWTEAFELVERGEVSERVRECVELVDHEGLGIREIAERLGIGVSTVGAYLRDPTGQKTVQRKAKRSSPCVDCGRPCNTDGSVWRTAKRCADCAKKASIYWTRNRIIAAIQRWADLHGRPPKGQEWSGSRYQHPDYPSGDYPAFNTVRARFGSFNTALKDAGFEPYMEHGGQPRKPLTRQQLADTAALAEKYGIDGAAERLGMTTVGVRRRVKQHKGQSIGGEMPAPLKAEDIIDRELEKAVQKEDQLRRRLEETRQQTKLLKIARNALKDSEAAVPSAG